MTKTIKTACPLDCYDACSMIAHIEGDRVVRVEGNPEHPITQGRLCTRGYHLVARTNSEARITQPQKRVGDTWHTISWEQAYAEIAERITGALQRYGPTAIMNSYDYGSSGLLKLACDRFFHMLGGATETVGSICWAAGLTAQEYDFGRAESSDPQDLARHAKGIVVWGRNVAVTNVHQLPFLQAATRRGAKLVVINPLPTALDSQADEVVRLAPGTDGLLALAVCKRLVERGCIDRDFIDASVSGYDEFVRSLDDCVPAEIAKVCGIDQNVIASLADLYADGPVSTLLGIGLQRHVDGGRTIRAIDALAMISGNVGRPGSGVHYANRHALSYVDFDFVQSAGRPKAHRQFARTTQAQDILTADPPIEVLFVSRTNLVGQLPDTAQTIRALRSVQTVIVIDHFHNATSLYADYFLPATTVFEEEDVMFTTMWNPYVAYAHAAVAARGQSKPDWMIFRDLARVLGLGSDLEIEPRAFIAEALAPWLSQEDCFAELLTVGYKRLPLPVVGYAGGVFVTPSGKAELWTQGAWSDRGLRSDRSPWKDPSLRSDRSPQSDSVTRSDRANGTTGAQSRQDDQIYPYHLLTVHPRWQENSQSQEAPRRRAVPEVVISVALAKDHALTDGDQARVFTATGELVCIVRIEPSMRDDTVQIEQGWHRAADSVNLLVPMLVSDLGIGSAQYDARCAVVKLAHKVDLDS